MNILSIFRRPEPVPFENLSALSRVEAQGPKFRKAIAEFRPRLVKMAKACGPNFVMRCRLDWYGTLHVDVDDYAATQWGNAPEVDIRMHHERYAGDYAYGGRRRIEHRIEINITLERSMHSAPDPIPFTEDVDFTANNAPSHPIKELPQSTT